MKIVGIILILLTFQSVTAQPREYQSNAGFCHKIFNYIHEKPEFIYTRQAPKPRYIHMASPSLPPPRVRLTRNLPFIDSVYIRGGVDLQIIGGSENKIAVKRAYEGLAVKVCNGAIYISNTKPVDCNQNPRPCIKLYMNQLRNLTVAGNSCVTGCHVDTYCGLSIEHCGGGSVCFNGPVNVVRIMNNGNAAICINGVMSDHIHILATHYGSIQLSGRTGLLLVRAFQHSSVDTRFMCSETAMVQAEDEALVTVKTIGDLRAFASGMSNVYYYTTPGQLLTHSLLSGNVFQMGGF